MADDKLKTHLFSKEMFKTEMLLGACCQASPTYNNAAVKADYSSSLASVQVCHLVQLDHCTALIDTHACLATNPCL